ncbi:MAG: GntR family transcriptional regulator [Oscillochloris sp.]|nr:GntR family transcriptional regulator [Oscillochloris sp.]
MDSGSDPIYQRLRRLIIEGYYPPGTRLVEDRLARDLGVSRTPIREALTRVAIEGLVQITPNRGAVVRTFSREDLIDTFDLRAVIEGHAAYRAALRITSSDLEQLEQTAVALESFETRRFSERNEEVHYLVEHNHQFHAAIIAASANRRLQAILPMVVDVPMQYRSFFWYTRSERAISNFFHRGILHALRQRDADRARALMQEHIYHGRDVLLESLRNDSKLEQDLP